ncbi:MAG: YraN family protein, partial [Firmicutes bacterium]|nr:YraN family protein [Bacillota bacterium]
FPSEAVTEQKQQHLRSAAMFYLHSHPGKKYEFLRMDVIEVLRIQGKTYVRHIENAF